MGNRSSGHWHGIAWRSPVRKRAAAAHARKKRAKRQQQHLEAIKSPAELRRIVLGSRHLKIAP